MTFSYIAVGRDGRRTTGTIAADSRAAAISLISRQGMHPVDVGEDRAGAAKSANGAAPDAKVAKAPPAPRPGRVSPRAVEEFTRELANLLAGGVPLSRALALLRRESSQPAVRHLWGVVHDDVVGGSSLADSMAKHPKTFSGVYVAMVRAGEAGGFLDVVLGQIADFRTREQDLKGKVKAALIYPALLACVAAVVVVVMLAWFIPKFSGIFAEFGGELPALTRGIVAASSAVRNYGWLLAGATVAVIYVVRRAMGTEAGRLRVERATLAAPLVGRIVAQFALVRFCRMLGTLAGAGVPLVASLRVAREAIGNQTLADTVSHAIREVQRGAALSKSLAASPRLFPAGVLETILIAEESGRLDKELVRIAGTYEADLDRRLRMLVSLLEPLLLFVMASLIGTIVVGMLLPVFNLQDTIK